MPRIEVELVRSEDLPRVLEVWESSVRATHWFLSDADVERIKPLVRDAVAAWSGPLVCVRDEAGRVAGFLGVDEDKIEMLFVDAAARGRGAGRALVEYAVSALGATHLDVNEQNPQAVGFYERLGFGVVGRSDLDGQGQPFPLLHMRLKPRAPAALPVDPPTRSSKSEHESGCA